MDFKCVREGCGKDFKPGNWECYPGQPHEVAERTYHIGTGVDKIEDRAKQRVMVYYTPDIITQDAQGNKVTYQAKKIDIIRGTLVTGDPEVILFMDTKYKRNLITREEWEKQFIHEGDLLAMKKREFENKQKLAASEENELLSRVAKLKEEAAELEKNAKSKEKAAK